MWEVRGAETRQALGIAVVGGLIFSELLTLFITPAFFVSMERLVAWTRRGEPTPATG